MIAARRHGVVTGSVTTSVTAWIFFRIIAER
jgi:hypothetical protein